MAIFATAVVRLLALRSVKSVALSSASSTTRFWASYAFVDLFLIVGALAAALSAEVTDAVSSSIVSKCIIN